MSASARVALAALLLASVAVLATTKTEDTDAWTHLALGRQLVEVGGFPATEQFTLAGRGMPYHNSEWLFGFVFYLAWAAGGFTAVVLLKAALVTLAFAILLGDSLLPNDARPSALGGLAIAGAVLFSIVLAARYRFVERPDILLMVFLAFTVHALNLYVYASRRALLALPVLQIVWVNTHPSVILGAVPFGAYLVGGAAQRWLSDRRGAEIPGTPTWRQLRTIAATGAACAVTSLVNPYTWHVFTAPFELAGARWFMDEIRELQPPRFQETPAPFIVTAALVVALLLAALRRRAIVPALLAGPFVYLGLSGRRFMFLLAIVAAPILARELRALVAALPGAWLPRVGVAATVVTTVLVVSVSGVALARVGPFTYGQLEPGLGATYRDLPEGALRYLDRVGVTGGVYNTYQWGGYIVWRDHGRRVPMIDGRGWVPRERLDDVRMARGLGSRMRTLDADYRFDAAVLTFPDVIADFRDEVPDVDLGWGAADWALVYWDDVALVYLRRTPALAPIIARDEYRHVKPVNGPFHVRRKVSDPAAFAPFEKELRRAVAETGSWRALAHLGFAYLETADYPRATAVLSRLLDAPADSGGPAVAHQWLGLAYQRQGDLPRAIGHFREAVKSSDDPLLLYNMALALTGTGKDREAAALLEKTLRKDPYLTAAYPVLVTVYRRLGREDRAAELTAAHGGALRRAQGETHFVRALRFYTEARYPEALEEFRASIKANPRSPAARSNLGYLYFDIGRLDDAFAEQQAALDVDPNFANAHYGLALIHRRRGNADQARAHFQAYLRLEPKGYWARKSREYLAQLNGR